MKTADSSISRANKESTRPMVEQLPSRLYLSASIAGTGYNFQAFEHQKIGYATANGSPLLASFKTVGLQTKNVGGYSAVIDWSDGTSQAGAIYHDPINPTNHLDVGIASSKTMPDPGILSFKVYVRVIGTSLRAVAYGHGNIADIQFQAKGDSIAGDGSRVFSDVPVCFFFDKDAAGDTDPTSTPANFTATIDWGDGSRKLSAGIIVKDDMMFTVFGTHTYAANKLITHYKITVKVYDDGGASATVFSEAVPNGH